MTGPINPLEKTIGCLNTMQSPCIDNRGLDYGASSSLGSSRTTPNTRFPTPNPQFPSPNYRLASLEGSVGAFLGLPESGGRTTAGGGGRRRHVVAGPPLLIDHGLAPRSPWALRGQGHKSLASHGGGLSMQLGAPP